MQTSKMILKSVMASALFILLSHNLHAAQAVGLEKALYKVFETNEDQTLTFNVVRGDGAIGPIAGNVTVTGIEATAVADFRVTSPIPFSMAADENSREITFTLVGDAVVESSETISLVVTATTLGFSVFNSPAIVAIRDDDTIALENLAIHFGEQTVGTQSGGSHRWINSPVVGSAFTIRSIQVTHASSQFRLGGTCRPGEMTSAGCDVEVIFSPVSANAFSEEVIVTFESGEAIHIPVTGTGVMGNVPSLSYSIGNINFGSLRIGTSSPSQEVTVTNHGRAPQEITKIVTNLSDYSVTTNCPTSLAVDTSCTVTATFFPTEAGPREGRIDIVGVPEVPQSLLMMGIGIDESSMGMAGASGASGAGGSSGSGGSFIGSGGTGGSSFDTGQGTGGQSGAGGSVSFDFTHAFHNPGADSGGGCSCHLAE